MPVVGLIAQAGGSLINGYLGSRAASRAGRTLNDEAVQVTDSINKAGANAQADAQTGMDQSNAAINTGVTNANTAISNAGTAQQGLYNTETTGTQPYQAAGVQGLNKLQSTAGTFSFNPSDLQNDPGYQFQLQQGNKALAASAAGRGMLQSGRALKAMDQFSQGLAGTSYQNAYNRALTTYKDRKS